MEGQNVGEHDGSMQEETSERVVLFGNGNIVVTREDIVHLTTEPRLGRESLWVHVMPNRYTQSLPFRSAFRKSSTVLDCSTITRDSVKIHSESLFRTH